MLYALTHFLNIGLGLLSPDAMEAFQDVRHQFTRMIVGELLIYGCLTAHTGLALYQIWERRTLNMPFRELAQNITGFVIPLFLIAHIIHTKVAHEVFALNDDVGYIMALIWNTPAGWTQALLLLLVWGHGCAGLHFWLRGQAWWRRSLPLLAALAALVPSFALAGYLVESRRLAAVMSTADGRAALMAHFNWPDQTAFAWLIELTDMVKFGFFGVVGLVLGIYLLRKVVAQRTVSIIYEDGPHISAPQGMTLLEMSRSKGVPHMSLCGGRGRCTTCRVKVHAGAHNLPEPDPAEARSLEGAQAAPGQRLACQIRPTAPLTVSRVFLPNQGAARAHASLGTESALAILFLDMRGFTARTAGQLPYDVVFLLNRFFDAIVPAITEQGGTVDKYLGDGFLAVFETSDAASSARAGLAAARDIGIALEQFNAVLSAEGEAPVGIGIGLHLGDVVLGEIGAQGNAPRTLIGDAVNTASRLEGKTKELGVELLVSEVLLRAASVDTTSLPLTSLELRGVAAPLPALPVKRASDAPTQARSKHPQPALD